MDSNLLKLKISFITAYPKEGTEKLWFVGFSSPEWSWIKIGATYDFAIGPTGIEQGQVRCHLPQSSFGLALRGRCCLIVAGDSLR